MHALRIRIVTAVIVAAVASAAVAAQPRNKIYLDYSGIDARADLTKAQKKELKSWILSMVALKFGYEKFYYSKSDPTGAARIIKFHAKAHAPDDRYGDWPAGSRTVNVYIGAFMDDAGVSAAFKTGGRFDVEKLGKAMGETAAHETGHSYGVGHNKAAGISLMTDGGRVTAKRRAADERYFSTKAMKIILKNAGKKPAKSAPDFDLKGVYSHIQTELEWGPEKDDEGWRPAAYRADARLVISTPLPGYYFGFIGYGEDGGYDFIAKSSLDSEFWMDCLTWSLFDTDGVARMSFAIAEDGADSWVHPDSMTVSKVVWDGQQEIYQELTLAWEEYGLTITLDAGWDDLSVLNGWSAPCDATLLGDANGDGAVDTFDIDAFLLAIVEGREAWETLYEGSFRCANDINGDGSVDFFDIDGFVALVIGH